MTRPIQTVWTDEKIITVLWSDGGVDTYRGNGTVWKRAPYMVRPGSLMETKLSEIEDYCRVYGNPYPTAHERTGK